MQSTEERRRLLERHGGEQHGPLAAVLRCAAGLLALVVIAAGPWVVLTAESGRTADSQSAYNAAKAYPNSMEESRRVFEERRLRYQGGQHGTKAALAK